MYFVHWRGENNAQIAVTLLVENLSAQKTCNLNYQDYLVKFQLLGVEQMIADLFVWRDLLHLGKFGLQIEFAVSAEALRKFLCD